MHYTCQLVLRLLYVNALCSVHLFICVSKFLSVCFGHDL